MWIKVIPFLKRWNSHVTVSLALNIIFYTITNNRSAEVKSSIVSFTQLIIPLILYTNITIKVIPFSLQSHWNSHLFSSPIFVIARLSYTVIVFQYYTADTWLLPSWSIVLRDASTGILDVTSRGISRDYGPNSMF